MWVFSNKTSSNVYLLRSRTHRTRRLKFKIRQKTAVRDLIFVKCHNLETVSVHSNDCRRLDVSALAFWQNWEAPHKLCVPSPPSFVYFSSAFGGNQKQFRYLQLETAMTAFTIMFFVCVI